MTKIFWCKNCLNMSTRPRIEFDKKGWCNACNWVDEKKKINWNKKLQEFKKLIKQSVCPMKPIFYYSVPQ